MRNVGVIGNGFVGSAVANGFSLCANVKVYDKDPDRSLNSFSEIAESEYIFICVPTPMASDGSADLTIIDSVLEQLFSHTNFNVGHSIIIIKSTVPPGTIEGCTKKYSGGVFVSNPEFLTERSANLDFINASRIVLGGHPEATGRVVWLYRDRFPYKEIVETDFATAQFIKYMCNCFFAVKISFMNEMFQAAKSLDVEWEDARRGFVLDGRIGNSHLDVPGHDGYMGFGGKCFPKDISGFIKTIQDAGISPLVLIAAWERNLEVRQSHDWEYLKN